MPPVNCVALQGIEHLICSHIEVIAILDIDHEARLCGNVLGHPREVASCKETGSRRFLAREPKPGTSVSRAMRIYWRSRTNSSASSTARISSNVRCAICFPRNRASTAPSISHMTLVCSSPTLISG